jgi:hypothetical protein
MPSRFFTLGVAACAVALSASSGVPRSSPSRTRLVAAPGTAQLRAFGGRSAQQRANPATLKFDAALADLSRHAALASPSHVLADLHAMSPAARFKLAADGVTPLVAVDAVTRGDPRQLEASLEALGLEHAAVYSNDVGGWLPVSALAAAVSSSDVHALRAAMPRTRTGAVTSQGDFVQNSATLRASDSLTGSGITVGVLSDSYNCYAAYAEAGSNVPVSGNEGYASNGFTATAATDVSTGDLPSGVNVLEEADCLSYGAPAQLPFGDEGRAMLQIVHDVAPGASLAFYTAENTEADFANGIGALAKAGAKVIADDVGYFDEPFYQDGILAQAIDAVEAPSTSGGYGVAYFSAAGNDGNAANSNAGYENTAPQFSTLSTSGEMAGEYLLNFDTTGASSGATSLPITIDAMQPGELVALVVEWDQPYVTGAPSSGGATSQIDICVTGTTGVFTIENNDGTSVTCTGPNKTGVDPVQILIIANPANASGNTPQETLNLSIGLAGGTAAPGRIKLVAESDGQNDPPITAFATNSSTLQGHPGAAGAAAVGAAFYFDTPGCGSTPAVLEAFSSSGGAPILFDSNGTRLATPVIRQKPNFTGPDGGNDTFLGYTLASDGVTDGKLPTTIASCQNDASYPNFFGTSAATPHVAGIAALLLQANAALSPAQIYSALQDSALPMGGAAGYNVNSGFGFVQAQAAIALLPPGAPTLTAAATTLVAGTSTTLTWSDANAANCAASGSWSGTLASSGSQTVSPTTTGAASYTLTCGNGAGTSPASSVTIDVTAASSGGGGGGGGGRLDWTSLLALSGLALWAARYRQRS